MSTTTEPSMMPHTIRRLSTVDDAQVHGLAELLIDCVEGGASVSFMHPLPVQKAVDFWRHVADGVAQGERALLVAEDVEGTVGTIQLVFGQPENQPHRADLSKMLVHRRARRRGVGAALLRAAENVARECGKSLLVLDTASGDAERLYARSGWQRCGVIPGYALPSVEVPTGLDRKALTASSAAVISLKAGVRRSSSRAPASVGVTLRVVRLSRRTPSLASSRRTASLKVEADTPRSVAAARKLRRRATAENASRSESSGWFIVRYSVQPVRTMPYYRMECQRA